MNIQSPRIIGIKWGQIQVEGYGMTRDLKAYPGGAREWNWKETGTHHVPGIQPADVQELISNGAQTIILTRGMQLKLQTCPETYDLLNSEGIEIIVEESSAAVQTYNQYVDAGLKVGGLFHSTC